jgi:hypothetical protein
MAKPQPFHAVFLERVIAVVAVQRHRAAAIAEYAAEPAAKVAEFFDTGRLPGSFELYAFQWSLEEPKAFHPGQIIPDTPTPPMLPALQRAWDAAVRQWLAFIAALINGELVATGTHQRAGCVVTSIRPSSRVPSSSST